MLYFFMRALCSLSVLLSGDWYPWEQYVIDCSINGLYRLLQCRTGWCTFPGTQTWFSVYNVHWLYVNIEFFLLCLDIYTYVMHLYCNIVYCNGFIYILHVTLLYLSLWSLIGREPNTWCAIKKKRTYHG